MFTEDIVYYLKNNYIPTNPIIIDAGANNGIDSIKMTMLWPYGKVYAFEPNPRVYEKLKLNANANQNIETFNIALGEKDGFMDFYMDKASSGGASSLFTPRSMDGFEEPIQIPVMTLDSWARQNGVGRVDFMWLDMQGGEGHMLHACPEILKTVKVIHLEFFTYSAYKNIMLLNEVAPFLTNLGFKILYLEPEMEGNAIFVRKLNNDFVPAKD